MNNSLVFALIYFIVSAFAQNTPVIGGSCKTGTPDVQIGAKQTQFFLKCEANDDSQDGNGIWVVKSRAAAAPGSNENQNAQQHPQKMRKIQMSNVCEQDSSAREGQACTTSETCLQQNYEQAGSYLQCDSTSQRWIKRSCQQDFVFSFEHQSCIGHTKTIRHVARKEKLTKKDMLNETVADFPIGPPGFGLPREISTLDRVLIKASGNGCAIYK
uniref:Uncharacterized protein n=1 Tax=Panagrolaimus sp. ES5 TaxID=591445 RepID=A0AC34FN27_9BILA